MLLISCSMSLSTKCIRTLVTRLTCRTGSYDERRRSETQSVCIAISSDSSGVFRNVKRGGQGGGTEGPERGAEARSAEAPRGVGSGEGRRSLSPVWGSGGYAPRKFKKKSTLKSRIFRHFCKLLWSLLQWRKAELDNRVFILDVHF